MIHQPMQGRALLRVLLVVMLLALVGALGYAH